MLLNLAPLDPDDFAALVGLVRDGGVVVSTTAFMATPGDERRGVDAKTVFVRADTPRLAAIVALVDAGELIVAVDRRIDLVDLPALHAEAMAGRIAARSSSSRESIAARLFARRADADPRAVRRPPDDFGSAGERRMNA